MRARSVPAAILFALLTACAARRPAGPSAQETDYRLKMKSADRLFDQGCFFCLTDAFERYQELVAHPQDQGAAGEKLFKTSLVLALREKELGMHHGLYQEKAPALLPDSASEYLSLCLEIVGSTFSSTGSLGDERLEERFQGLRRLRKISESDDQMQLVKQQTDIDGFGAYIYISLMSSVSAIRGEALGPKISGIIDIHSESPPVLYKYALSTDADPELLDKSLQLEPRFHEAHYFLAKTALKEGDLYGGDAHLAEAYRHFPDSLTMVTLLGETALEMGEMERSLEHYEKATSLAPTHRGALLGKAKCLSFLGRNRDAIQLLHEMIALGKWYLGEAHYWLAWNEHELGQTERAVSTIEEAKKYLPMDTEVFTLSGIMAFEQERIDQAIHDLEKAKKFDFNKAYCEAPFHLGMIYSSKEEWENSASNFERAGQCHSNEVRGLEALIFGIRASSLANERKQPLLLMRGAQKDKAALNEGTAFYNAAAGYFNAGLGERAWNCAINASQHEYFKDKASDLIAKIQDTLKN